MSDGDAGRDLPAEVQETTAAAKGTAAPVDVAVDPRARTTIAVFLAAPLITMTHFLAVYLVTEAGCTGDGPGLDVFDPPVPAVFTLVATAVAALGCCATALWSYRRWRPGTPPSEDELVDRRPVGFIGLLFSLLGLVTVLLVGLPALVLEAC